MFKEEFFTKGKTRFLFGCLIFATVVNIIYSACSGKVLLYDGISRFGQLLSGISSFNPFGFINYYLRFSLLHYIVQFPVFVLGLFIKSKWVLIWLFAVAYYSVQPLILWFNFSLAKRTKNYSLFVFQLTIYSLFLIGCQTHPMFEMPVIILLALSVYHLLQLEETKLTDKILTVIFCAVILGSIEAAIIFTPILLLMSFLAKPGNKIISNLIRIPSVIAIVGYLIFSYIKIRYGLNPIPSSEFAYYSQAFQYTGIKYLGLNIVGLSCLALFATCRDKIWKWVLLVVFALIAKAAVVNLCRLYDTPVQFFTMQVFYQYLLPIIFYGYMIFDLLKKRGWLDKISLKNEYFDLFFSEKFEMIALSSAAIFLFYFSQFISDSAIFYPYLILLALIFIFAGYFIASEKTAKVLVFSVKALCIVIIISSILFVMIKLSFYNWLLFVPVIFAVISYKNVYNADFKDENNVYKESFVLLVLFVALIQTVSQFGFCKNCQKYFEKFEQIYAKVEEPIYILPQNKIFDDVNEDELPVFQNYVRPSMYPAFSIVLSKDYDVKSIILPSGDSPDVQGLNYYNDIAIDNEFNRVMFFYSFYDMKNKYWDFSRLVPEIKKFKKNYK